MGRLGESRSIWPLNSDQTFLCFFLTSGRNFLISSRLARHTSSRLALPTHNRSVLHNPSGSSIPAFSSIYFPPPSEENNSLVPKGIIIASSEEIALRDNADSLQDLSCLFSSRPLIRLESQQSPKGDMQSLPHVESCCTPKELLEFSNSYKQNFV